jgi:hypothetical protein
MLARVEAFLRERHPFRVAVNADGEGEGGEIVLDENCIVSPTRSSTAISCIKCLD